MDLDKTESLLQNATAISFEHFDPMATLYFPSKETSIMAYNIVTEMLRSERLIMGITVEGETLSFSLIFEKDGNSANVKNLDFNKGDLERFLDNVSKNEKVSLFTGYIIRQGAGLYPQSNMVTQQKDRLWLLGYVVS